MGEAEAPALSCMEPSSRGSCGWGGGLCWRRKEAGRCGCWRQAQTGKVTPNLTLLPGLGGFQTSLPLPATLEAVYFTGRPGRGQKEG